jgi:hypothetical protein
VAVVVIRVEEEIGVAYAREVLGQRHAGREHEASRIDAARACRAPKVLRGDRLALHHPQHAAGHRGEDSHPRRKDVGRDLGLVVEAAEHHAALGQPQGGTGGVSAAISRPRSFTW